MVKIAERIDRLREAISSACARSARDTAEVRLVIVTKSASFEAIMEVIRLGFLDLGENRAQQLKKVAAQIEDTYKQNTQALGKLPDIRWHMIGHLQRNKVRQVLPLIHLVHSIDTLRLAEEINAAASKTGICPNVLLQVNTSEEPQKYGVSVGAAPHLAEQIETLPNVKLVGLMTMAPLTHNKDEIRKCFIRARELFVEMKGEKVVGSSFTELSMGMSSDYEIAIEEGATILRIGSAIFSG
jgi:PLP dependent protein